jgi:glycosyltransferase involved in cell wall biosynthesis
MTPLLSICIPTYNRAELLRSALLSLMPQVRESAGEVELVVSDNCSTDDTRQVVEWARGLGPLRYHRNAENIGAIPNLLLLADDLAAGEFCWLLGDDDMLRPGAVAKVVEILKSHPELDYVYVNYSVDAFERRERRLVTADDFREWTRAGSARLEERGVQRWEELLAEDVNCLTAMYCSVFRRSVWLKASRGLKRGELYSSAEWTYTPTVIFARTMVGKPAWSTGFPWVVVCSRESWSDFIPAAMLLRFHELLDVLVENGVDAGLLDRHRRKMLVVAAPYLADVLRGRRAARLEGFSVAGFLLKHRRYPESRGAVYSALVSAPLGEQLRASPFYALLAVPAKAAHRCLSWRAKRGQPARPGAEAGAGGD